VFKGKLDQLSPIALGSDFSNKLRTFAVIVSLEGSDPKLMPDLSAAVDIEISERRAVSKGDPNPSSGGGL
jgi:hypothetical protein